MSIRAYSTGVGQMEFILPTQPSEVSGATLLVRAVEGMIDTDERHETKADIHPQPMNEFIEGLRKGIKAALRDQSRRSGR